MSPEKHLKKRGSFIALLLGVIDLVASQMMKLKWKEFNRLRTCKSNPVLMPSRFWFSSEVMNEKIWVNVFGLTVRAQKWMWHYYMSLRKKDYFSNIMVLRKFKRLTKQLTWVTSKFIDSLNLSGKTRSCCDCFLFRFLSVT